MDPLPLIFRWLHIGPAIVLVGGAFFMLVVLHPALSVLPEDERAKLRAAVIKRWKLVVHVGVLLFLVSGFYNYIVVQVPLHKKDGLYHGLMGLKMLLGISVFFIAEAMVGRSKLAEKMRQNAPRFLVISVSLAMVIMLISGFLKTRGVVNKPANDAVITVAKDGATGKPVVAKSEFDVVLTGFGDSSKISVIKVVREVTGLGLKDAKDLVEGAPKTVKTAVPEAEAQKLKAQLEAAGGKVEIK